MADYNTTLAKVGSLKTYLDAVQGVSSSVSEPSGTIVLTVTGDNRTPYMDKPDPSSIQKWVWYWDANTQEWKCKWVIELQDPDDEDTQDTTLTLTWSDFD